MEAPWNTTELIEDSAIAVGIAVSLAEELLFRGFLQTWLKRWLRFPRFLFSSFEEAF